MKKAVSFLLFFSFIQLTCQADGYWLELQGNGRPGDTLNIKIRYGGVDEQKNRYIKTDTALNRMEDYQLQVIDPYGKEHKIPIKQKYDCWEGFYVPMKNGTYQVFAVNDNLPVVEREDNLQNIKPVQYLCTIYNVGQGPVAAPPTSHLYQKVSVKDGIALVTPSINSRLVPPGTALRIFYPNNQDKRIIVANKGTATLQLSTKGIYLVRLDQVDHQTGTFKGKKYYAVRHRCDYTLSVE